MLISLNGLGSQLIDPTVNRNGTPTTRRLRTAPEFFVVFDRLAALIPSVLEKLPKDFTSDQIFDELMDEDRDLYREAIHYHGNRPSSQNTVRSMLIFRLKALTDLVEPIGLTYRTNSKGRQRICTQWRKI